MNKEILFAKTLEQIRQTAKEQGNCISEEQVKEAFAALSLDEEQLQMVFDYLVKHKVGINVPANMEDYLTDGEKDYLQEYLDEISALPDYTPGEVEAYTISAMAGNREAQNRVVEMHLKDVAEIAKLYAGQGVFLEDLIGEGNVALAAGAGMLGSLETPDEAQGMLGKLIMDAMEEYIRENASGQRADQRVADKVNLVMEKARELSEELRRKVTAQELARETGLSLKAIQEAMSMSGFQIEYIEKAEQ